MAKKLISFDEEKSNLGLPDAVEERLDGSYATKGLEEQVAPQKMHFELPVPKPHRAPNLAIQRAIPDETADLQVILDEGKILWAVGRDRSLYKSTPSGQWEHKAYLPNGVAARGGLIRCQDGSLLHFDQAYRIRRSTNEGSTWTLIMDRRTAGLEPLTTQSVVVQAGTGHIYYGEYTNGVGAAWTDVVLWRSTDHGVTFTPFYTFQRPVTEHPEAIVHIHSLQVDPYTDEVYVMTGDGTPKTGIWKVQGDTCVPVLTNDMMPDPSWHDAPRCISMMFFPDYIAWGSDSTTNPYLFRIPRSAMGVDPSKLVRGPRLSSTAWGAARASEDGSRWVLFASDEAFPNHAPDRMAHIYAVEDQGATIYEVGVVPSKVSSGVTTLMPLAQPERYGLDFWFSMRTGAVNNYGAWQARLGYGAPAIPWPARPRTLLTQSQSSGQIALDGAQSLVFGGTRVPVYAKNLAIYDSTAFQHTGGAGTLSVQVVVDGSVVWSSGRVSSRSQGRTEFGGPVATIPLSANTSVEFRVVNEHANNALTGTASITFGWVE